MLIHSQTQQKEKWDSKICQQEVHSNTEEQCQTESVADREDSKEDKDLGWELRF